MLGAIAGDIIGSAWESAGAKRHDFPLFTEHSRFTDDSVMTVAVAHALLDGLDYAQALRDYGRRHPFAGYGQRFGEWIFDATMGPYGSYGNGGAMRVSPVGFLGASVEDVLAEARRSAEPTHGHPEAVKGAQAVALAVFLARRGASREEIRREISGRFGYDLARSVAAIRPGYSFDVSAERSVPEAIICFLDADDFEDAVRNAVSLGGDTDTMACIAGGIAEAFWGGVPAAIAAQARARLPREFLGVLARFEATCSRPPRPEAADPERGSSPAGST